jgi:hypothetical protein
MSKAYGGFSMKSTAPCSIAETAVATEPRPEIIRIGAGNCSACSTLRSSRLDLPGITGARLLMEVKFGGRRRDILVR